jgi:deglycase
MKGAFIHMSEKNLDGVRVAILATNGYEEAELVKPKQALEDAGAKVTVIAPEPGEIYGMKHHDKSGNKTKVDMTLQEANADDFDAVVLPGGALNADALRDFREAQEFVRTIDEAKKPIAVICHGPWLLVSAGLVKGRKLTSWPTVSDDIRNAGGLWEDKEVLRDGNFISSRKPDDIPAFNKEMIAAFAEGKQKQKRVA